MILVKLKYINEIRLQVIFPPKTYLEHTLIINASKGGQPQPMFLVRLWLPSLSLKFAVNFFRLQKANFNSLFES